MRRITVRRLAVAAALAPLVLARCGHDGSVSITSGAPAVARTDAGSARGPVTAQRIVLTAADLPGYSVDPGPDPDATSAGAAADFQQCAGAGAAALADENQTAQSPGFRLGTTISISSLATLAVDEATATAAMNDLSRPAMHVCVTGLLRSVLERDVRVPVTSASTELLPGARGSELVTWRTTMNYTSGGSKHVAYSDLTFLRSGRALASLFAFQKGEPFSTSERNRLVGIMSSRMAAL